MISDYVTQARRAAGDYSRTDFGINEDTFGGITGGGDEDRSDGIGEQGFYGLL